MRRWREKGALNWEIDVSLTRVFLALTCYLISPTVQNPFFTHLEKLEESLATLEVATVLLIFLFYLVVVIFLLSRYSTPSINDKVESHSEPFALQRRAEARERQRPSSIEPEKAVESVALRLTSLKPEPFSLECKKAAQSKDEPLSSVTAATTSTELLEKPTKEQLAALKQKLGIDKGSLQFKDGSVYVVTSDRETKKHVWKWLGRWRDLAVY